MHFVSCETFRTSFRNPACSSPTLVVILRWAQSSEKAFQILTSDNSLLPDKTILPQLLHVIWTATESLKNCWLCLDTFWKLWTFSWVSRFSLWKLVDYMDPAYNPAFILKVLDLIDNLSSPRAQRAGPRAESARAVTGRRNSHRWEGGRLFDRSAGFFYGNSCNSGTESRKIVSKVGN